MNKRKEKMIIVVVLFILIIAVAYGFKIFNSKNNIDNLDNITTVTTTLEERQKWNDFLKNNPYISEIEFNENLPIRYTDLIKLALSSKDVEKEYIVTDEILEIPILSQGEGYKKSKEKIEKYIKATFNKNSIEYNFIETFVEGEQYLILGEEYIYYTEIELAEREYILMELKKDGNNFEALIYEYEVNDNNRSEIEAMLESGIISQAINKSKTYTITGTMKDGDICIITKK